MIEIRVRISLYIVAIGLLAAVPVQARTCFISQATAVAFGIYLPVEPTPLDATAEIRIICNGKPTGSQTNFYTVRIDGGTSGNPANRYMESGLNQLLYNIYKNRQRTDIWGDGTNGTTPLVKIIGNGNNSNRRYRVYGRIPAQQDPASGGYIDVVTVTVEF